jgi:hypothetical protein
MLYDMFQYSKFPTFRGNHSRQDDRFRLGEARGRKLVESRLKVCRGLGHARGASLEGIFSARTEVDAADGASTG